MSHIDNAIKYAQQEPFGFSQLRVTLIHLCMAIRDMQQPSKREWVGLTMNEMDDLMEIYDVTTYDYIKAIEAKLKEKNQ